MALEHIDTQILSYSYKGMPTEDITGAGISSVVAKEFLWAYGASPTKDRYYLPVLPKRLGAEALFHPLHQAIHRDHPYSKHHTDQFILDFSSDFPSFIEYGSLAFSYIINSKNVNLMRSATSHMPKEDQKSLRQKFEFLNANNITCIPLCISIIHHSYKLLEVFLSQSNPKKLIRNTLNDLLILGTAIQSNTPLKTDDKVLERLASKLCTCKIHQRHGIASITFNEDGFSSSQGKNESKGYINKSWKIHQHKNWIEK